MRGAVPNAANETTRRSTRPNIVCPRLSVAARPTPLRLLQAGAPLRELLGVELPWSVASNVTVSDDGKAARLRT